MTVKLNLELHCLRPNRVAQASYPFIVSGCCFSNWLFARQRKGGHTPSAYQAVEPQNSFTPVFPAAAAPRLPNIRNWDDNDSRFPPLAALTSNSALTNDLTMLLVRANAGPSKIHQIGLVARQFIPAETIVWRFQPGFDVEITEAQFQQLSPTAQEQVVYYAYFDEARKTFMLSSDDERLTNHSDDPNTKCREDYTYAVRDISEGEEITNDYREFKMLNFQPE